MIIFDTYLTRTNIWFCCDYLNSDPTLCESHTELCFFHLTLEVAYPYIFLRLFKGRITGNLTNLLCLRFDYKVHPSSWYFWCLFLIKTDRVGQNHLMPTYFSVWFNDCYGIINEIFMTSLTI